MLSKEYEKSLLRFSRQPLKAEELRAFLIKVKELDERPALSPAGAEALLSIMESVRVLFVAPWMWDAPPCMLARIYSRRLTFLLWASRSWQTETGGKTWKPLSTW